MLDNLIKNTDIHYSLNLMTLLLQILQKILQGQKSNMLIWCSRNIIIINAENSLFFDEQNI